VIGDPKKVAALVVGEKDEPEEGAEAPAADDDDGIAAAEDFLKAVKRGDAKGVKSALEALMETCYPELGSDDEKE
jgi:hypothetical protein